jgi:hypothetical protein
MHDQLLVSSRMREQARQDTELQRQTERDKVNDARYEQSRQDKLTARADSRGVHYQQEGSADRSGKRTSGSGTLIVLMSRATATSTRSCSFVSGRRFRPEAVAGQAVLRRNAFGITDILSVLHIAERIVAALAPVPLTSRGLIEIVTPPGAINLLFCDLCSQCAASIRGHCVSRTARCGARAA